MLAVVDYTNVLVALIAGLPAIIAAAGTLLLRRDMKGPSGVKPGAAIERAHDTVVANNMLLRTIMNGGKSTPSVPAGEQAPASEGQ